MKANTMKFYLQLAIVGMLVAVGTIALISEPTDDANFVVTVISQLVIMSLCYGLAAMLGKKWQINRKLTRTGLFQ